MNRIGRKWLKTPSNPAKRPIGSCMVKPNVFLDSSVLITALLSEKGASFYLLMEYHERYQFIINDYVLTEILDVLKRKFSDRSDLPAALFLLLGVAGIKILSSPPDPELTSVSELIEADDAPILVSALGDCNYLLTLDQDFLKAAVIDFASQRKLIIQKPGDFLSNTNLT